MTHFCSLPFLLLISCAAAVSSAPTASAPHAETSVDDAQTLVVLKAQQMIAACNAKPGSTECYASAIAYYTGRVQTPLALMEQVRDEPSECGKRCLADLGLHAFGWTREEALARTKLSADVIDALLAWPGEALVCLDSQRKNEKNPHLGD